MTKYVLGAVFAFIVSTVGTAAIAGGGALSSLHWPINDQDRIVVARYKHHHGIYLVSSAGVAVQAVAAGEVIKAVCSENDNATCRVVVAHNQAGYQFRSVYEHMKDLTVVVGQSVDDNTTLGVVSAKRFDPAVHFELKFKNVISGKYQMVNGADYMQYFQ